MTGAMYAAISGLKTHMSKLNVIGNNVANVNTYGYKASRTVFQESLYTTTRSGSNGSATSGGINPSQIGYGCSIGSIDLDMSTKNYVPTGISRDCMIDGDGFFLVGPKPGAGTTAGTLAETNAKDLNLTRVGNFTMDAEGYLVDGNGNVVYGFATIANTTDGKPGICDYDKPGVSTQLVPLRLPMFAKAGGTIPEGTAIFPGLGAADANGNQFNVYDDGTLADTVTDGKTIQKSLESITIDGETGKVSCVNSADGKTLVIGYIAMAKVDNPNGVSHISGPYYRAGDGAGDCEATSLGDAMKGKRLNNVADPTKGKAVLSAGKTSLITGGLESSGTDVATEFSDMITAQRGYQANTRIITVTDAMLEELVNIKR